MSEPQLFTKTNLEAFQQDTRTQPYISFRLGTGGLKRLVIKIWSHDQGWCEHGAITQDHFANSHTWFSLGLFNEKAPENAATPDLYEFQRNVTASEALRCYTHEWNIGTPAREEDSGDEVDGWIESLAEAGVLTIGVFPLAEYEGWENWVSKMEVLVFSRTPQDNQPHDTPPVSTADLGDHIGILGAGRQHSVAVRLVDPEEKLLITRSPNPATPEGLDSTRSINLNNVIRVMGQLIQVLRGDHSSFRMLSKRLGILLGIRYSVTAAMDDLQRAIDITQQLVDGTHQGHPERVGCLHRLALQLLERHGRLGAVGDIQQAIDATRQAVAATPPDHPDWTGLVHSLGFLHGVKYSRTEEMEDLQRTTETLQQAVDATPLDYPDRFRLLQSLGIRLGDRYSRTGSIDDLQKAIETMREAVDAITPGHPERARSLHGVGVLLMARYKRTKATADLDEVIESLQQAISASPRDDPDRAERLGNLGNLLGERFIRTRAMGDLQRATETLQQAVAATPRDHPRRAEILNDLGSQLGDRFSRTGAMEDIQESIALLREAADTTPQGHPRRVTVLTNLGNRLGDRFNRTGEIGDLQEAIETSQQAVNSMPLNYDDRAACFNNLGNRLSDRFDRMGAVEDLENSIKMAWQAVGATPADHPERAGRLGNLGNRLGLRFQRMGATEDLEKSIEIGQQAADTTPANHPELVVHISNLGNRFGLRFQRTGATEDLEKSIEMAQQAVNATPADHPDRVGYLSNLGNLLGERFRRTGAMSDLEESIEMAQQAVNATPADHPDRVGYLSNLGNLLGERFRRTGAMSDLEESIEMAQQAVNATPADHPDRASVLIQLAVRSRDRFGRTGADGDLQKAIEMTRISVEATPLDHTSRAERLDILASRFLDMYDRTGAIEHAEEGIKAARLVIAATPSDHPKLAPRLNNLGIHLLSRFVRTERMEDLQLAIEMAQEAVNATPQDHPNRAALLTNLGNRLLVRHGRTRAPEDLEASYQSYKSAFYQFTSPISDRIRASRRLLSSPFALQDEENAFRHASEAVGILPQLTPRALRHADKQHLLVEAAGVASDAAALAILAGQPVTAVSWLEAGRGVLAGALQDIRTDLSNLRRDHASLAAAFEESRSILDAPAQPQLGIPEESTGRAARRDTDLRLRAQAQLDRVIREIRLRPGYERFLLPPTEDELSAAAANGPVVVINVSHHRCDALIVQSNGIQHCELPSLTYEDVQKNRQHVSSGSVAMLKWLWDAAVCPVFDILRLAPATSDATWPRVWWTPTGPLVGFPLHAAGYHAEKGGQTALDYVISSYATSIRSVIPPQRPRPSDSGIKLVLVDMQETPNHSHLSHAVEEALRVEEVIGRLCSAVARPERVKPAVQAALSGCQIFHFAGHGTTDPRHPLQSRLLLTDWREDPLTVESLLQLDLQRHTPFLAYLSACGSGRVLDDRSVDESIHLSSACQLAGFRHVIGTLWSVDDALCVEMAKLVYGFLAERDLYDEPVSHALHWASRQLRDAWAGTLDEFRDATVVEPAEPGNPLWVPYVHYGP
ncbi:hypothetical protein LX36DRAFT_617405 [Colletotrichum falcatum]|nr:hypothetical protein LX36DRAFT_617405 [Colletotrichum falcatum]